MHHIKQKLNEKNLMVDNSTSYQHETVEPKFTIRKKLFENILEKVLSIKQIKR